MGLLRKGDPPPRWPQRDCPVQWETKAGGSPSVNHECKWKEGHTGKCACKRCSATTS